MSDYYTIHNEDCLLVLASMPDESIDSIVTDPPYLISFMGKDWDSADGIAGQPDVWRECLRVLKPGGHLLAFGATRTYHRMTVAIEDAGFEIRDSIHWTYGSGFPKSLDVSKAIDKMAGAERKVVGSKRVTPKGVSGAETRTASSAGAFGGEAKDVPVTAPATDDAARWSGFGTALKPSHEPIVVARKPLAGTVAQTVLEYGTGALNIDGCRVGTADSFGGGAKATSGFVDGYEHDGWKPGNPAGRWPANTILTHSAGCRKTGETAAERVTVPPVGDLTSIGSTRAKPSGETREYEQSNTVYACVPGCPVAEMDRQSGTLSQGHWAKTKVTGYGKNYGGTTDYKGTGEKATDKGGASRFFTQCEWDAELDAPFLYVAKPAKKERNAGLDGLPAKPKEQLRDPKRNPNGPTKMQERFISQPTANTHPTVKPVALMRHLCRLVTPPGGVVLDPFVGSGTTGVAALLEGFQFIGIEREAEYLPIVEARLSHAEQSVREQVEAAADDQPTLFSEE